MLAIHDYAKIDNEGLEKWEPDVRWNSETGEEEIREKEESEEAPETRQLTSFHFRHAEYADKRTVSFDPDVRWNAETCKQEIYDEDLDLTEPFDIQQRELKRTSLLSYVIRFVIFIFCPVLFIIQLHDFLTSSIDLSPSAHDFSKGSLSHDHMDKWIISPDYKLLVCSFPKAGSRSLRSFMGRVESHCHGDSSKITTCQKNQISQRGTRNIQQKLQDPAWIKLAFFRDPRERFLSAYINKCTNFGTPGSCINFEPVPDPPPTFDEFTQGAIEKGFQDNAHYVFQSEQCGGISNVTGFLDFIGVISDMPSVYAQMASLPELFPQLDTSEFRDAVDAEFKTNERLHADSNTYHVGEKQHKRSDSLAKDYYTDDLRESVTSLYAQDYQLLRELVHHEHATNSFRDRFQDI